jgi:hypothetical protein
MGIVVYQKWYNKGDAIEHFIDMFYTKNLTFLASDLLDKGVELKDLNKSLNKAMTAAKTLDLEISHHFKPIYTQKNNHILEDFKLSKIGFVLVMINCNPKNKLIANLQLSLAKMF